MCFQAHASLLGGSDWAGTFVTASSALGSAAAEGLSTLGSPAAMRLPLLLGWSGPVPLMAPEVRWA